MSTRNGVSRRLLRRRTFLGTGFVVVGCFSLLGAQCLNIGAIPSSGGVGPYNNTSDKTNDAASYVGAEACNACHGDIGALQAVHGHSHKLTRVQGQAPQFPAEGTRAGVPNPPDGFTWDDISYVIGGYTKKGRFIDQEGYILVTGVEGVDTQWNLDYPANGTTAGFVAYEGSRTTRKPYDFSCFVCHTTGALPQDEDFPEYQENRPGFAGTWQQAGIQCEECHGPGSNHIPNTGARDMFVDSTGADTCHKCHNRPFDSQTGEIQASGGYIKHHEQYPELMASGGHAAFTCTTCHDPHVSVIYDRENAIRNECTACHTDVNMASHEGKVFTRGDYTEVLSCESCHMPFASRSGSSATAAVVGDYGRMGDTRTHIFRINTEPVDYTSFFSADMSSVVLDEQGRAAVTVDFACLRCHNGIGAFEISLENAADVALRMHGN